MENVVAAMGVRLWRLGITVRWPGAGGNDRTIALSTQRVAVKQPNP